MQSCIINKRTCRCGTLMRVNYEAAALCSAGRRTALFYEVTGCALSGCELLGLIGQCALPLHVLVPSMCMVCAGSLGQVGVEGLVCLPALPARLCVGDCRHVSTCVEE
jgi:hypothetical protein